MSVEHAAQSAPVDTSKKNEQLAHRLATGARGLVFIWLGVCVLAHLGWGWTLTGIGVILLGEQVARWRLDLAIATRWAIGGAVFLIGGLWQLIHISFPLAPLLLILLGIGIIWNGFFGTGGES